MIDPDVLRRVVRAALDEDVGPGDLTSRLVIGEATRSRGRIVARENLTVAGLPVAEEVFRQVDATIVYDAECADGAARSAGECCATVEGIARSILAGERTALNFLQRMSGIATATRRAVSRLDGARVQADALRDTQAFVRLIAPDSLSPATRAALAETDAREAPALLLAAPEFQRR